MTVRLANSRRFQRALGAMLTDYYHDFGTHAMLRARGYRLPREVLARALALLADEDPWAHLTLRDRFGGLHASQPAPQDHLDGHLKGALDKLAQRMLR